MYWLNWSDNGGLRQWNTMDEPTMKQAIVYAKNDKNKKVYIENLGFDLQ
jgi:hypothetical protein